MSSAAAADEPKPAASSDKTKPNIIFILSDDVGLGNIACCGGDQFKTPNIDELARTGTRFERCYSTPLCGPSRAQVLTGRYPFRTGMISNQSGSVMHPQNEVMIPTVLKKAGYVTASVGKWNQLPLQPGDWGFDEYLRFPNSGRYWREQTPTYTVNGEQKDLPEGTYLPDLMHDFCVDFMTRHRDRPFFLYYPMSHIHAPIVRTPDSTGGKADFYADNIAYMDKLVGKLINELERLKLREKTLVIFVGDNGTAQNWAARSTVNGKAISGCKATMLEGGSRVPMIVNWPGTTPAGKVRQDLVDFSDFYLTFADLAGAKLPETVKLDGHSLAAQIKGERGEARDWVYVELNGKRYARDDRYKLTGNGELLDLKNAPYEETSATNDAEQHRLQKVLDDLASQGSPGGGAKAAATMPDEERRQRRQQRRQRRMQRQQQQTSMVVKDRVESSC